MHSSGVRSGPGVTVHRVVRPVRMLPARNLMNTMQRMPHQASNHNLVRCMASGGGEKSWTDLAGDAFQLARTAATKVVTSVSETASSLFPKNESRSRENTQQRMDDGWNRPGDPYQRRDLSRNSKQAFTDLLGGGLLARGLGGMMSNAFENLEKEMRNQQQAAGDVQERAVAAIQNDPRVRDLLGDNIQLISNNVSQSMSMSSINGRMTKQVTIAFAVAGSSGRSAQAQATSTDGGSSNGELDIIVQLPNGRSIQVDPSVRTESSSSYSSRSSSSQGPIDVEWREIK